MSVSLSPFTVLDPAVGLARDAVAQLSHLMPVALGIVVFTLAVRLLLHPLARAAARGEKTRNHLAPRVTALRERHRKDPDRMQRELTTLYREEGVSPLSGCLPLLLQVPFTSVMYRLFTSTSDPASQALLGHTLLGVPLSAHLTALAGAAHLAVFCAVLAGLLALGYLTYRRTRRISLKSSPLAYLSFGTAVFAAFLPLAAGLYLLTTTAWTLGEKALLT
ncbi:YidC/Oxa1 family membrane protein insertase [Streptacidiphilus fuscans]|uniref:Membrane protein insertase YidC n=1 Tax=Streptacidiphilus fuscans TaxID=2789292 RepID=A0A931FEQ6_9ACTN|nr:membrane protein insertase YidC [Streptacidiphilus fuscans]MBF9069485.1 membrane protein insertase YidC [Streptacidiphilus fuscans]